MSNRTSSNRVASCIALVVGLCMMFAGSAGAQVQTDAPTGGSEDYDKRAQTGMKFTQISVHPRASALANSVTSLELGATSMFYNPAGMARLDRTGELSVGVMQWIADINHNQASLAFAPGGGQYGTVGLLVRSVDYGEINGTIRADVEKGYLETETVEPTAMEVGLSYARALTTRFSVGGTAKWVQQDLGTSTVSFESGTAVSSRETKSNSLGTPAFDFGVRYDIGFRSLALGVSARNFAPEVEYVEESFELPLTLRMGLSMDMFDLVQGADNHSLLVSVDASNPRDFSEQISVGGRYEFMDLLSLRAGYIAPADERGVSFGGGLHHEVSGLLFRADYAYTDYGRFDNVSRIALTVGF